jgi:DNA-directed RNA polymerase specialized sigma24 family protein
MNAATQELEREVPALSGDAFTRLLHWLDDGTQSNGETYLEMRRRLVAYFDRRNRPSPDALADETFDRITRTLQKDESIAVTPPARYCYVIARFVLLEDLRRVDRTVPFDETRQIALTGVTPADETAADVKDRRLACLDRCLTRLSADQRELVVEYYRDAKRERIDRRREIAARLGITMNALGIRLCRLRAGLESCVGRCCEGG